ncbi:EbhA [Legionella pneumophila]|uniref:EbhA n=1 Tax=Legionella pneumophila TaxID=446 RepID=UPI001374A575|nr:EbhA [Legionella pneumophila]HAT1989505.1 EbhA [Legionella pneumophila]HAT1992385.1 EbhA [Legionella pneumophila]HAT2050131.1 EbhA [Legionella pneumophila]HAT2058970.1 EbhA [Legionella pneumophila]HAT2149395.1 EbhA [Legionella pneumophila]
MLFKLNKSSSHKPEQISRSYHRLMLQLKTWETNHYTPDLNEEYFRTLDIETRNVQIFYNDFVNNVLIPLEQQPTTDLPEFITQEDIFNLLSFKIFMPLAPIFAEREQWMKRIAGTDGKNAHASESYNKFKKIFLNSHHKFVIEESLSHFEHGTLKYHHEWLTAKRQIAKEVKSLRALQENWKEKKNKIDRKKAAALLDFLDNFESIPNRLRSREEEGFKRTEVYKKALSTDKLKAIELLNQHLFDYSSPQEELAERMKLIKALYENNILFEQHHTPIGWLKNQLNIETVLDKKLASLEQSLKAAENALNSYMEHRIPKTATISTELRKEPEKDSIALPEENKSPEAVSENQNTSTSNPEIQPQTNPVQNRKNTGKVYLKVQQYEENLRRLGVFTPKTPPCSESLKKDLTDGNRISL